MQTEKVLLSQVAVNENNPRTITSEKLQQLMQSILVFPKMLELRPVVVDEAMKALGGNMRTTALNKIAELSNTDIFDRLTSDDDFTAKTEAERDLLIGWWGNWLKQPYCYIVHGDSLSEDEKKEFMVKDNVAFGAWDWQKLTKKFPATKLERWGMDGVPKFTGLFNPDGSGTSAAIGGIPIGDTGAEGDFVDAQGESFIENGGIGTEFSNLPPELAGLDLTPDKHEDIEGDDQTVYQRIIITYREKDAAQLCALLGLAAIGKVVYAIEELVPECAD